jgi:hypothetical protein
MAASILYKERGAEAGFYPIGPIKATPSGHVVRRTNSGPAPEALDSARNRQDRRNFFAGAAIFCLKDCAAHPRFPDMRRL